MPMESRLIPQPAQHHDYQPGWTIVGSGLADKADYRRPLASLIPAHFAHIPGSAAGVEPQSSRVVLADGTTVGYESLVVAAGLQISESLLVLLGAQAKITDYDKVAGLTEALSDAQSKVATIYSYETADKTWHLIREFDGKGEAIFTQPFGPVKCAGGEHDYESITNPQPRKRSPTWPTPTGRPPLTPSPPAPSSPVCPPCSPSHITRTP